MCGRSSKGSSLLLLFDWVSYIPLFVHTSSHESILLVLASSNECGDSNAAWALSGASDLLALVDSGGVVRSLILLSNVGWKLVSDNWTVVSQLF